MIFGFAADIFAQVATVKSMGKTLDFISGNDQRRDFNNDLCALLKIQVLDDILDVEGNVMGEIVNRGVEKWVYMAKGSKNLKIHFKNHLPLKIIFLDYNIGDLEGNCVYELVLEVPNSPSQNRTITKQTMVLEYRPVDATVMVDSKIRKGNGRIELLLPVGEHKYMIAAEGYITIEGVVELKENSKLEIVRNLSLDYDDQSMQKDSNLIQKEPISPKRQMEISRTTLTKKQIKGKTIVYQAIQKGVKKMNYHFDYSMMQIETKDPKQYIMQNVYKEVDNPEEAFRKFTTELEETFINSANDLSLVNKGYKLENKENVRYEVIIYPLEIDGDGEHYVYGIICDKETQQTIASLNAHCQSGRDKDFKTQFLKRLSKSGEIFGDKLADDILSK